MLFKKINKKQLKEIMELEKEVLGTNKLTKEEYLKILNSENNFSFAVYSNKKMIGFIISHIEDDEILGYYLKNVVDHFVFKNKRALYLMLLMFPLKCKDRKIMKVKAIIPERFLKLVIRVQKELYPVILGIDTEHLSSGNYKIVIKMEDINPKSIKYKIMYKIYEDDKECVHLGLVLNPFLRFYINHESEEEKIEKKEIILKEIVKYKKRILRLINKKNLELLNTLGENYNIFIMYSQKLYGNKTDKFLASLENNGYNKIKRNVIYTAKKDLKLARMFNKKYHYDKEFKDVCWFKFQKLDDKYYDNTLTFFRHILKKHIIEYYFKNNKNKYCIDIILFDKYGDTLFEINKNSKVYDYIPLVNRRIFDAYIKRYDFIYKVTKMAIEKYKFDEYVAKDSFFIDSILDIKKYVGEEEAYMYLEKIAKAAKSNQTKSDKNNFEILDFGHVHDHCYPILELFNNFFRQFLTKGAYKVILKKSINQINKVINLIKSLNIQNQKDLDIKYLRKEISKAIKKDLPIENIINNALELAEKNGLKERKLVKHFICNLKIL